MEIHELTWQRRRVKEATHSGVVGPTRTTAQQVPPGSKESETYAINPEQLELNLMQYANSGTIPWNIKSSSWA